MRLKIIFILMTINIVLSQEILYAKMPPTKIHPEIENLRPPLGEDKDEWDEFLKAWLFLKQGEMEKALDIVRRFSKSEYQYRWRLLLSAIYKTQERYKDALKVIEDIRPGIEKAYTTFKDKQDNSSKDILEHLKFYYYKILLISGISNVYLKNWSSALKDLLVYSEEYQHTSVYEYIGLCYYKTEQYSKAIFYFNRSYQMTDEGELKDTSAYNIGAMNAILSNVEEAIFWLKIPLDHNRKLWLQKVKEDKDFDTIRNNNRLEDFLKEQEKELEKEIKSGKDYDAIPYDNRFEDFFKK